MRAAVLYSIFLVFSLFSLSYAESEITEGYDENTEITVRGTITEIIHIKGPVILKLKSRNRVYDVVTAPPWYLSQEKINFQKGHEIEVTGSKYFGKDGNLYIITRQIRHNSFTKTIQMRDGQCRPLWRRHGINQRMIR